MHLSELGGDLGVRLGFVQRSDCNRKYLVLLVRCTVHPRCLTLYCVSQCRLAPSFGFITDPLLTALSPDFDLAWGLAPHPRRLGLRAQRYTANGAVHAHTLVFTAGLEALPVAVDHTVVLTACSHHIWQRGMTSSKML